jgi:S-(hydroxymethyl)glutathione dehydrogenase / alcohol dehydrogenase
MKTKAAVLYEYKKPLVIEELDLDEPKKNEILVQYKAAGLCHSDLSIMNGIFSMPVPPCVVGHEGAGIVTKVGPGVRGLKEGDHVLGMWVPTCGECYYCLRGQPYLCVNKDQSRAGTMLDGTYRLRKGSQNINIMAGLGTFSEYNVINEKSALKIDPDFPFDIAAIIGCGVITGVGAVMNTAKVKPGSSVAVVGLGGVGQNIIQGSVLAHATKIIGIDILDNKLELAEQLGATDLVNASREDPVEKVMELTRGMGVDYAFEAIGSEETAATCFKLIRRGGFAVMVGVPPLDTKLSVPLYEMSLMQKSVLGCYYGSANLRVDLITLQDLYKLGRLKVDELITQRYKLEDINKGFDDLISGKNARAAIIY